MPWPPCPKAPSRRPGVPGRHDAALAEHARSDIAPSPTVAFAASTEPLTLAPAPIRALVQDGVVDLRIGADRAPAHRHPAAEVGLRSTTAPGDPRRRIRDVVHLPSNMSSGPAGTSRACRGRASRRRPRTRRPDGRCRSPQGRCPARSRRSRPVSSRSTAGSRRYAAVHVADRILGLLAELQHLPAASVATSPKARASSTWCRAIVTAASFEWAPSWP